MFCLALFNSPVRDEHLQRAPVLEGERVIERMASGSEGVSEGGREREGGVFLLGLDGTHRPRKEHKLPARLCQAALKGTCSCGRMC